MIKQLRIGMTPEEVYFFQYSREERRKHSKGQKIDIMRRLFENYKKWETATRAKMTEVVNKPTKLEQIAKKKIEVQNANNS